MLIARARAIGTNVSSCPSSSPPKLIEVPTGSFNLSSCGFISSKIAEALTPSALSTCTVNVGTPLRRTMVPSPQSGEKLANVLNGMAEKVDNEVTY